MTLMQVWGTLLIFTLCPLLGGLPLIEWIVQGRTGRRLSRLGTGNISVSAAFYHGGTLTGILAVLSEALKGIAAVLLARHFFPASPAWEVIALIALVMGRYWVGKGAGTTNVVWGYVVHDPIASLLILIIGGIGFTLLRERQTGKLGVLVLLPVIAALLHPQDGAQIGATVTLSFLIAWIYRKIPDDLDLPADTAQEGSRQMFRFFRGDRALRSLDQSLRADQVGQKAATLSQLKRWGYPVPMGWILPPGDDPAPLIEALHPTAEQPLVVRSSAIGEDSETASAAGQYESLLNITSQAALEQAILRCQASYNLPHAMRYRQDQGVEESGMAVLMQIQVQGVFSGVAFSRDPISRQGDTVVIEALPGTATQIVSGRMTPEQYRVWVREEDWGAIDPQQSQSWILPDSLQLPLEGEGEVPPRLIQQVAYLARHLESRHHGIPQDIEWSYDGQTLWLLQARPITTLLPIWTRKIAAEVIPGFIHPLTWSINRPLTCGAWGELFTKVLGNRAQGLDFNETATLHHSAAYFNASLLGEIFRRMGLPAESLEFLTRGAKFSKPPLSATLRNVPGLLRLLGAELRLEQDFNRDVRQFFDPGLAELAHTPVDQLAPEALLQRIEQILLLLKRATYYSILAPLSAALRQAISKTTETDLDNSQTPEIASVRSLQTLALQARDQFPQLASCKSRAELFATLSSHPTGTNILQEFDRFLSEYGYLSEVGTDIAVPTWKEDSRPVQELFTQFLLNPVPAAVKAQVPQGKGRSVQRRVDLKGRVTTIYSKLLAELRWSFVALENVWRANQLITDLGDVFLLKFAEIQQLVTETNPDLKTDLPRLIADRKSQLEHDRQLTPPLLIYGNTPPLVEQGRSISMATAAQQLVGIGASPGQVEGRIVVLRSLQAIPTIDRSVILVVPYTDSGWAPLLAQAGGLIAEVGGRLSHGAIIAREYGIPAVMNIAHATDRLHNGQQIRLDGESGIVEIL